jgi:hypothetical protein
MEDEDKMRINIEDGGLKIATSISIFILGQETSPRE